MDMTYKNMVIAHSIKALPNSVDMPDYRLCIGDAERLESIPVLLFTDVSAPSQKPKFEDVTKQPIEKFGFTGEGSYIDNEDFESDDFYSGIKSLGV